MMSEYPFILKFKQKFPDEFGERLNLLYYNIFKFECFTQYLIAYPLLLIIRIIGLGKVFAKRSGKENWDEYLISVLNSPKDGISLHFAGLQVTILLLLLLATPWNVFCGLLQLHIYTFWLYGGIVVMILAFVLSFYVAPNNPKQFLGDFKKFELLSTTKKRKSALLTFLIVIGIWSAFIGSFIFYLRSIID